MSVGTGLTITGIFSLAIGVYFLSALIPGAMDSLFTVNTSAWDPSSATLFTLIPLAIIAGIVLIFVPRFGGQE
jgi:hypothetical protein